MTIQNKFIKSLVAGALITLAAQPYIKPNEPKNPQPVVAEEAMVRDYNFKTLEKYVEESPYTHEDIEKAVEAVFAEARGEDQEYMEKVATTIYVRALEREKPIREVVSQKKQYSYLNPRNKNQVKAGNAKDVAAKNILEKRAYERAEKAVKTIIRDGVNEGEFINHYFVTKKSNPLTEKYCPSWAFEKKNGRKVPRKPVYEVESKGKITRFYYIPEN